jgi:hypothetical protein
MFLLLRFFFFAATPCFVPWQSYLIRARHGVGARKAATPNVGAGHAARRSATRSHADEKLLLSRSLRSGEGWRGMGRGMGRGGVWWGGAQGDDTVHPHWAHQTSKATPGQRNTRHQRARPTCPAPPPPKGPPPRPNPLTALERAAVAAHVRQHGGDHGEAHQDHAGRPVPLVAGLGGRPQPPRHLRCGGLGGAVVRGGGEANIWACVAREPPVESVPPVTTTHPLPILPQCPPPPRPHLAHRPKTGRRLVDHGGEEAQHCQAALEQPCGEGEGEKVAVLMLG